MPKCEMERAHSRREGYVSCDNEAEFITRYGWYACATCRGFGMGNAPLRYLTHEQIKERRDKYYRDEDRNPGPFPFPPAVEQVGDVGDTDGSGV